MLFELNENLFIKISLHVRQILVTECLETKCFQHVTYNVVLMLKIIFLDCFINMKLDTEKFH